MTPARAALALPALLLLLWACRAVPPQIEALEWELTLIEDPRSGGIGERLALFLLVSDEDGEDDPAELFLSHPEQRLYWRLDSGEWERRSREGQEWIGSSGIAFEGGLPRGEYRILLTDRAGKEVRERIYVGLPAAEELEEGGFPRLVREAGGLRIETGLAGAALVTGEDAEGRVVVSVQTEGRFLQDGDLGDESDTVAVWYLTLADPERGCRVGSGPYRFYSFPSGLRLSFPVSGARRRPRRKSKAFCSGERPKVDA